MCGRFVQSFASEQIITRLAFPLEADFAHQQRFNLAPTQLAAVIHRPDQELKLTNLKWGFSFYSSIGNRSMAINTRIERVVESKNWNEAIGRVNRRVLIPVNGYYEWKQIAGQRTKTPFYIHHHDQSELLFIAGILDPDSNFSILTRPADDNLSSLHPRMPISLQQADMQNRWLFDEDIDSKRVQKWLNEEVYTTKCGYYAVSKAVNKIENDHAELLEEKQPPAAQLGLF